MCVHLGHSVAPFAVFCKIGQFHLQIRVGENKWSYLENYDRYCDLDWAMTEHKWMLLVESVLKSNLHVQSLCTGVKCWGNIASEYLHVDSFFSMSHKEFMNFATRNVTNVYQSTPGDAHIQGTSYSQLPHFVFLHQGGTAERFVGLTLSSETIIFH